MTKNVSRKSAKMIVEWCIKHYGPSKYADLETLSVRLDSRMEFLGEYCPVENQIILNPKKHRSLLEWCSTVIHEYTHFRQNMDKYSRLKVEYSENPYELESNSIADRDKFLARLWLLRKLRASH
jgi:hypothetical protein